MEINNSCCCCLLRPRDKYLKMPYTCLGKTEIYANMLKDCFEIHLIISSYEGYGICEVCVRRLRDASDFKLQVQSSQAELQARLQGALHVKEEHPEKTEISDDDFGPDCRAELTHVSDIKTRVSADPLPSDGGEEFKELMLEVPEKTEIPDGGFGPHWRAELMHVSGEMKTEVSDGLPSDEDKEFKEFMIGPLDEANEFPEVSVTHLPRKEDYEQSPEGPLAKQKRDDIRDTCAQDTPRDSEPQGHHESGDHRNPYTCDTCGKQFSTQAGLNRHITRVHQAETEHICKICDKRFKWKSRLDKHLRSHKEESFGCMICDMRFSSYTALRKHKRIHKQVLVCDICKTQFTVKNALISHIRSHMAPTVLKCKFCCTTFLDRPSLSKHIRKEHANKSSYICDECKRVFPLKGTLVRHLNVHTKWRIYQCNICALTLSSEGSLRRHKLIHTAERPYACEVCKKRFTYKEALRKHKTIHTGEKKHCCDVCGKRFARSDYLRTHLKTHAEGASFRCELCPKSYSTKECLRQHKRTHIKKNEGNESLSSHGTQKMYDPGSSYPLWNV